MHVRGFTRHESSMTELPGTYLGLVEKLDHLKVYIRELLEKNAILPRDGISIISKLYLYNNSACVIIVHWKTIGHMNDKCSIFNKYKLSFSGACHQPNKYLYIRV